MDAQIARSGLSVLAPEPHRTTRPPAVEASTEPAICGAERPSDPSAVYAWDFRADLGGRWSSQARGRLGLGTVRTPNPRPARTRCGYRWGTCSDGSSQASPRGSRSSGANDSELTLGRARHTDEGFHGKGLLVLTPFDVGERGGVVDARNRLRRLAVDERRSAVVVHPFCDSPRDDAGT
jgi:hypothetical protein